MIRQFIKKYSGQFMLISCIVLITWFIFSIFNLSMSIFRLLLALILIIVTIYFVYQAIQFSQYQELEILNKQLKEELDYLSKENRQYQNQLEEYFLMWIHQMKTPITASQLMLENPNDNYVNSLREEMIQIENYANMALNYLKLSKPSTDMLFTQISLDEIIKPLLRKYRVQFINHHISLHYQPLEAVVVTDANMSSLMIEQLLNNALKYAKNKEIRINFDSITYQLTLKDNGIGIHTEDLPKIFDRGYSGFNGKLNEKSSGLGLYLVGLIAKRLNQPVSVDSVYGEGSTFTIHFHRTPHKIPKG